MLITPDESQAIKTRAITASRRLILLSRLSDRAQPQRTLEARTIPGILIERERLARIHLVNIVRVRRPSAVAAVVEHDEAVGPRGVGAVGAFGYISA